MTLEPRRSTSELLESGRRLRKEVPRSSLAELTGGPRDPLGILDEQNATRLQDLVPLRAERMSQSAFAFFRGTAALMAADLATSPTTGVQVAACGDAHVSNFGFYASPQRTLVFDLNDFDEAAVAPWEWDLKRLVTSVIVGGRDASRTPGHIETTARHTVQAYRDTLATSLTLTPLQRYYTHIDAEGGTRDLDKKSRRAIRAAIKNAQRRTGDRAVRRLTTRREDGTLQFVMRPPTMTAPPPELLVKVRSQIDQYAASARPDIQLLLSHYREVDVARRVVGVGSVGTRCSVTLFQDSDGNGFILQAKEAGRSVLEQYGRIPQPQFLTDVLETRGAGARVVAMQKILQAVSDPFLGYLRADDGDRYVRQFHDMKGSIEVGEVDDATFESYSAACAVTLARAHSQSKSAAAISGYIGGGNSIAEAIVEWSMAYADLSERDYRAFVAANSASAAAHD